MTRSAFTTSGGRLDGLETVVLEGAGLRASFAPSANLVLHSLTRGGRELLAQNDGLRAYAERGSTMGVPLLHPWANRLSGDGYAAAGERVALGAEPPLFKRDPGGLPIHGALPSLMRWDVLDTAGTATAATLRARLDWDPGHPAFALFPFPHRLDYEARLTAGAVRIALTLRPTADAPVPVSFGFHPYLSIPGGARAVARVSLPLRRRLRLDDAMIPTGEDEPFEPGERVLGDTTWDDGFTALEDPARFLLAGGGAELSLTFLHGYRFAQVFAPPGSDFVCFEPMTAPTDALVRGGPQLPIVAPGGSYETAFEVGAQ
jgi:galactose mutarotase-like enzyme